MSKKNQQPQAKPPKANPEGQAQETRKAMIRATACPKSPHHHNTRVYRTVGQTRFCVCDDCGHTWKQIGEAAGGNVAGKEPVTA